MSMCVEILLLKCCLLQYVILLATTTVSIYSGQWWGHVSSDIKSKLGFTSVCPPGI